MFLGTGVAVLTKRGQNSALIDVTTKDITMHVGSELVGRVGKTDHER